MIKYFLVVVTASALLLTIASTSARAAFPERDISLIVPWAPGGGTDTVARTLVKNAKKYLGVNVNVVNRTGGTGAVGMQAAAQSKPDGYTLGLTTFHLSSYRLMGVSPLSYRDFEPIMLINRSPAAFVVKADSQFQSMKDLIEYAKKNPGVVTVANSGAGATPHLTTLQLAKQQGVKFTMVPFDGAAPARTAVLGGHVTLLATGADEVLQFYKTKQMRFLAVMNEQRHPAFPDAQTLAESGYGLDELILDWRGLSAPKGTPADVMRTLRNGFVKMAEDPDFIRLMDQLALPRALLEGDKFGDFLANMEKIMEPALKEANLLKKE